MDEVNDKKFNWFACFIIFIVFIGLGILIWFLVTNMNKVEYYKGEEEVKEEVFVDLDSEDELSQRGFDMINVEYFENVVSNIAEVLYSGEEVKAIDLSDEQKMFLTLNYYNKLKGYYICGDEYEVKIDDLKKLFFESDNFIGTFKRNTEVNVGYFTLQYNKNFAVQTMGCYGMEGPTSTYEIKFDSAKKSDERLLVNVRMAYLYKDIDTYDEKHETFYAIGYKDMKATNKVQDKILDDEDISWEDYNVYQFEFKIDGDNLYFNKVSLV